MNGKNFLITAFMGFVFFGLFVVSASAAWQIETIDSAGSVGAYPSMQIDASDNLHISYYDASNRAIKYATNAPGYWQTETVHRGGVGEISAIAVDSSGNAHISYYDLSNNALMYATNASGAWTSQIVDSPLRYSGILSHCP